MKFHGVGHTVGVVLIRQIGHLFPDRGLFVWCTFHSAPCFGPAAPDLGLCVHRNVRTHVAATSRVGLKGCGGAAGPIR